ncbi:disulfide bond formation protein B [Ruixingdingia sedimenti]|uniref:Disulfide bond formation protein B n=1 Tax=Ruixingdingia sedimenti TaxID=3073604 RepID=A0ABU1F8N6_9RHOB|nr:disulfide bond formation protein B [Xinfangfangia sp. LG-4]MDR5652963.1 disulfide bond formation protein B [Xinfangfangia sp. LG-4]
MTRSMLIVIAAGGSALLLAGALVSQYGFGLYPCVLCLWQRWPHLAAVLIGALALALPRGGAGRLLPWLGALAALATAGIGLFHTGVERGWWKGLESCSGGPGVTALSPQALLDPTVPVAAPVRCDEVAFEFLTLSMASWNMILSLALVAVWVAAARRRA